MCNDAHMCIYIYIHMYIYIYIYVYVCMTYSYRDMCVYMYHDIVYCRYNKIHEFVL